VPRWISVSVSLIALLALLSAGGFVLARYSGWDAGADVLGPALKYSLYAIAGCCAYAGLVGVYHTILSVTGLDEEKGRGKERMRAARAEAEAAEREPS
jgi:hypothetical protein